jgi:AcrR family transcriptional regulator
MNIVIIYKQRSLNSVQFILMEMAVKKIQPLNARQRREAAKQNLREEILAVSREIIAKEGYAALTMRKLAERIGYSPASLYLHFRSREEIAQEVSRDGYINLLAELTAASAPHRDDPAVRLRAMAGAYISFGLKNPQTYALIFMEDPAYLKAAYAEQRADDPGTQAYMLLVDVASGLIAAGMKPSKVGKPARAVTAIEFAEAIWAALHGVVSLKLTCPAFPISPAEVLTDVIVETLLVGLNCSGKKAAR